jgi:hypothetical protein
MYIDQVIALAEKHTFPQAAPQSLSLGRLTYSVCRHPIDRLFFRFLGTQALDLYHRQRAPLVVTE